MSEFGIEVRSCVNSSSSNITCKRQEEIDTFMSSKLFNILLEKRDIQPTNYTNPTSTILKSYHRAIVTEKVEMMYLYLREVLIERDDGLVSTVHNTIKTFRNLDLTYDSTGFIPEYPVVFYFSNVW